MYIFDESLKEVNNFEVVQLYIALEIQYKFFKKKFYIKLHNIQSKCSANRSTMINCFQTDSMIISCIVNRNFVKVERETFFVLIIIVKIIIIMLENLFICKWSPVHMLLCVDHCACQFVHYHTFSKFYNSHCK